MLKLKKTSDFSWLVIGIRPTSKDMSYQIKLMKYGKPYEIGKAYDIFSAKI